MTWSGSTSARAGALLGVLVCAAVGGASASGAVAGGSSASGAKDEPLQAAALTADATPKASFSTGSGDAFFGVKVSADGTLLSFETTQGQEALFDGREGYAVCSGTGPAAVVHGHDTGAVEDKFLAPTFKQPTPGAFPLTVIRQTANGKVRLTQLWSKPDPVAKTVNLAMTVKNVSKAVLPDVRLSRSGDFDVSETSKDFGARTRASVWQFDDLAGGPDATAAGVSLVSLTQVVRGIAVEAAVDWAGGRRTVCDAAPVATPTGVQDVAMRMFYDLRDIDPGASRTVSFQYRVM